MTTPCSYFSSFAYLEIVATTFGPFMLLPHAAKLWPHNALTALFQAGSPVSHPTGLLQQTNTEWICRILTCHLNCHSMRSAVVIIRWFLENCVDFIGVFSFGVHLVRINQSYSLGFQIIPHFGRLFDTWVAYVHIEADFTGKCILCHQYVAIAILLLRCFSDCLVNPVILS